MATRFDHLRADDGEHVGYLEITEDGAFIPYDLLHRRRGEAMELDQAEQLLDAAGLRLLAEPWVLVSEDGDEIPVGIREVTRTAVVVAPVMDSATVAKGLDLSAAVHLPLPTDRLRPA